MTADGEPADRRNVRDDVVARHAAMLAQADRSPASYGTRDQRISKTAGYLLGYLQLATASDSATAAELANILRGVVDALEHVIATEDGDQLATDVQ